MFDDEVEVDESYFGGQRKGKRGRCAAGKVAVFNLLKRNGKVYTVTVPNTKTATLLPIIREQVKPDSIVYTDCYHSYDVLDVSEFSHFRINHSTHFAERQNHINGIENFWNQAKRHLRQFNGIPKRTKSSLKTLKTVFSGCFSFVGWIFESDIFSIAAMNGNNENVEGFFRIRVSTLRLLKV